MHTHVCSQHKRAMHVLDSFYRDNIHGEGIEQNTSQITFLCFYEKEPPSLNYLLRLKNSPHHHYLPLNTY